jgi:YD repeat-containing protein
MPETALSASNYRADVVSPPTPGSGEPYFLTDGLGSVVAVTNASGSVTNSYSYDPYGVTTESTFSGAVANPWRYTGQ